MADSFQNEINRILSVRRVQRYYGDIYRITKRKDLLTGDPLSIVSIITNKWPKKQMQSFMLRLLEINQVIDNITTWRSENGNNILHYACQYCRSPVIESIINNSNVDLINQLNGSNEPPMFFLKFNKAHSPSRSIYSLFDLFMKRTNNSGEILKRMLSDLKTCSISFISACYEEDISKFDEYMRVALLKYYLLDISIWNRHQYLVQQRGKFFLDVAMRKISHEAAMELLNCFQKVEFGDNSITTFGIEPYFHHIIYLQPEIVSIIHRNLDVTKIRFNIPFMKYNAQYLCNHSWRQYDDSVRFEILLWMLNSPRIFIDLPFMATAKIFNSPTINVLISAFDLFNRVTNEYVRQKLRPVAESYLHGRVFPSKNNSELTKEETLVSFPLNDLPSDLLGVVASFLPYQQLLAFAMTCKRYYQNIVDSHVVWKRKFQEAFPFDKTKEFTRKSYITRYKDKFRVGKPEKIKLENAYVSKNTLSVHQNIVTNCFANSIHFYDLETKKTVHVQSKHSYHTHGKAKRSGDTLYVAGWTGFELYSLRDFNCVGTLAIADMSLEQFDINDRWILIDTRLFDITTSKVVTNFNRARDKSTKSILRDSIAIACSNSSLDVHDLRTNSDPAIHLSFNSVCWTAEVSDGYIYVDNSNIEIRDFRKPEVPIWISPTTILDIDRRNPTIFVDLVSMNWWCRSGIVWDLTNYKWHMNPISIQSYTGETAICNGKQALFADYSALNKVDLPGSDYFPYSL